jgi:hypothetical protein
MMWAHVEQQEDGSWSVRVNQSKAKCGGEVTVWDTKDQATEMGIAMGATVYNPELDML